MICGSCQIAGVSDLGLSHRFGSAPWQFCSGSVLTSGHIAGGWCTQQLVPFYRWRKQNTNEGFVQRPQRVWRGHLLGILRNTAFLKIHWIKQENRLSFHAKSWSFYAPGGGRRYVLTTRKVEVPSFETGKNEGKGHHAAVETMEESSMRNGKQVTMTALVTELVWDDWERTGHPGGHRWLIKSRSGGMMGMTGCWQWTRENGRRHENWEKWGKGLEGWRLEGEAFFSWEARLYTDERLQTLSSSQWNWALSCSSLSLSSSKNDKFILSDAGAINLAALLSLTLHIQLCQIHHLCLQIGLDSDHFTPPSPFHRPCCRPDTSDCPALDLDACFCPWPPPTVTNRAARAINLVKQNSGHDISQFRSF